jgi:tetratricopeptide (TPR) repeat protein
LKLALVVIEMEVGRNRSPLKRNVRPLRVLVGRKERSVDPENPVVRLCVAGMQAEGQGDVERARRLFADAWDAANSDFERCIAAHYVARHQQTPEDTLRWNEEAIRFADAVGDERVAAFYPSLLLNLGNSYELLGRTADAKRYYDLAGSRAEQLPDDRYGRIVRGGVAGGQQRVVSDDS